MIYADPPWQFDNKKTGGSMKSGASQKYPTMPTSEIAALPVADELAMKTSMLFLWSTAPMLPDALHVLAAWGYTYKTEIIWAKIDRLGLGAWYRGNHEILLVGVRGAPPASRQQYPNVVTWPTEEHSRKPMVFRTIVESATRKLVEATARGVPHPRIELFATYRSDGWDAWGLSVPDGVMFPRVSNGDR